MTLFMLRQVTGIREPSRRRSLTGPARSCPECPGPGPAPLQGSTSTNRIPSRRRNHNTDQSPVPRFPPCTIIHIFLRRSGPGTARSLTPSLITRPRFLRHKLYPTLTFSHTQEGVMETLPHLTAVIPSTPPYRRCSRRRRTHRRRNPQSQVWKASPSRNQPRHRKRPHKSIRLHCRRAAFSSGLNHYRRTELVARNLPQRRNRLLKLVVSHRHRYSRTSSSGLPRGSQL